MVGLYQRRNPKYCVRCKIFKKLKSDNGRDFYHELSPSMNNIMADDNGFKTIYLNVNGHIEKHKTGIIVTEDLKEDEVMPDDKIQYGEEMFIIVSVSFEDNNKSKRASKRPYGLTTLEVRQ